MLFVPHRGVSFDMKPNKRAGGRVRDAVGVEINARDLSTSDRTVATINRYAQLSRMRETTKMAERMHFRGPWAESKVVPAIALLEAVLLTATNGSA